MLFRGETVWALERGAFLELVRRLEAQGARSVEEVSEGWAAEVRAAEEASRGAARGGQVAVVPILGILTKRRQWLGSSTDDVAAGMRQLGRARDVGAIVLDVDSPGGMVYGLTEAAAVIREVRKAKPVVAVANSQAASAAYWLASQASELLVTPSGEAGSVGVYGMHLDMSGAAERAGIRVSYIYAGRFKVEGNPFEPLTDEARAHWQERVDREYDRFVSDVAKGRRVSKDAVRQGFGEGRQVDGDQAVKLGMADAVGTLEDGVRRAAALADERRRGLAALTAARRDQAEL